MLFHCAFRSVQCLLNVVCVAFARAAEFTFFFVIVFFAQRAHANILSMVPVLVFVW